MLSPTKGDVFVLFGDEKVTQTELASRNTTEEKVAASEDWAEEGTRSHDFSSQASHAI